MLVKNGIHMCDYFKLDVWPNKPHTMTQLIEKINVTNVINNCDFKIDELHKTINECNEKLSKLSYISSLSKMTKNIRSQLEGAQKKKEHFLDVRELMFKIQSEDNYGQEMLDELLALRVIRQ